MPRPPRDLVSAVTDHVWTHPPRSPPRRGADLSDLSLRGASRCLDWPEDWPSRARSDDPELPSTDFFFLSPRGRGGATSLIVIVWPGHVSCGQQWGPGERLPRHAGLAALGICVLRGLAQPLRPLLLHKAVCRARGRIAATQWRTFWSNRRLTLHHRAVKLIERALRLRR